MSLFSFMTPVPLGMQSGLVKRSSQRDAWELALWVEANEHGLEPNYIAQQVYRHAQTGNAVEVARWKRVAWIYGELRPGLARIWH